MKKRRGISRELIWLFLTLLVVAAAIVSSFTSIWFAAALLIVAVALFAVFVINAVKIRRIMAALLTGSHQGMSSAQQSIFSSMQIPVVVTDTRDSVLWYNASFKATFVPQKDIYLENIKKTISDFDFDAAKELVGRDCTAKDLHFRIYSNSSIHGKDSLNISFIIDDNTQFHEAEEYRKTRPSVLVCTIDNYDETTSQTRESERSEILSEINRAMEDFINETNGILSRISSKSFIAVIEEQHISKIIEKRFPILDTIRKIHTDSIPVTLSIGVGRGAKTLFENHILARQALDMALGRGGDQAALKTQSGYEFYGGVTRAVEKRNKVKSRVIASALRELVTASENVIIMGHKLSDVDSLGSAIGLARFCDILGVDTNVVVDPKTTMAKSLYNKLFLNGYSELFISPEEAGYYIDEKTLVVVVDCHVPQLLDDPELLGKAKNIVVIDHHRKMVNHIDNAVLFYHEPYASSCCELISELIQQVETSDNKPNKLEAEAMLAGIMLDTKDFSVRTGVRTFDAAAYLRRLGGEPTNARLLFAIDFDMYKMRAILVSSAEIYRGCAVVVTDKNVEGMTLIIPQAADELLSIEGISASIVAVKQQNKVRISSRSLGAYNVQLIMESLGGGGHQTMAGVQLENLELDNVRAKIHGAIDKYLDDNAINGGS